jgi:hypothetical protein
MGICNGLVKPDTNTRDIITLTEVFNEKTTMLIHSCVQTWADFLIVDKTDG